MMMFSSLSDMLVVVRAKAMAFSRSASEIDG